MKAGAPSRGKVHPDCASPAVSCTSPKISNVPQKGAEKLMTINPEPGIPVHARELSASGQKSINTQSSETTLVASSGGELFLKGPPRPPQTGLGLMRWLLLSGFIGIAVAGGLFAYTQVKRRTTVLAVASQPKEKPIEGLEMKEPTRHSPDTVLDA